MIRRALFPRGFSTYKTSTGLVGLAVDPNARSNLLQLSETVLSAVQKIPSSSQYRVDVEKWFQFIHKTATAVSDVKAIEDEVGLGQIEEVMEMAKRELELIDYYHGTTDLFLSVYASHDCLYVFKALFVIILTLLLRFVPHYFTSLLPYLTTIPLENRGWEVVENAQRIGDALAEEMADSIYFSSNGINPSTEAK